ncbi:MAG TPA: YerC/YecD family TrpR-related protein [Erysipelothrix sp.]|nr:YerC/YecD family TrpR-related protein [Erysipelothrix sp.]
MKHKTLYEAILKIQTLEEAEQFFNDIATDKERDDFSDRLRVANLLLKGKTYETIQKETRISSATIARVNRAITYGNGGYKTILDRIKKD